MKINKDLLPFDITNDYGNSTTSGYSQRYINRINKYSTTEYVVGVWGSTNKPLYRKLYQGSPPSGIVDGTETQKVYETGLTNIGMIFIEWAFLRNSGGVLPMPFTGGHINDKDNNTSTSVFMQGLNVKMKTSDAQITNYTLGVSLLYTKTTD